MFDFMAINPFFLYVAIQKVYTLKEREKSSKKCIQNSTKGGALQKNVRLRNFQMLITLEQGHWNDSGTRGPTGAKGNDHYNKPRSSGFLRHIWEVKGSHTHDHITNRCFQFVAYLISFALYLCLKSSTQPLFPVSLLGKHPK